jgi:NADH-quinone oxidoreductase subunit H
MFALDPLFNHFDFTVVMIVVIKVLIAFAALMVSVMAMVWFERKIVADMQNRIGPNIAGPFGILQTLADGIKLFFKEDLVPEKADRFVFKLAPYLALVPAFLVFVVVPIGGDFTGSKNGVIRVLGRDTLLQLADPHIGILFVLAMSSLAVYGVTLAGWSSGSKYPLLGSVRATAQMISYEAALGLSLLAVLLNSGSLSTNAIVKSQSTWNWNLWATGLVPFVIFLIAATAELNRPPFDFVEAEQELVGGFHTEYSSLRFALFFLAEFMNVVTMSAIIVTLFLGGPSGPLPTGDFFGSGLLRALLPTAYFFIKLLLFLFTFVWFRGTLPRFRYDQLMDLGWKVLIPLSLGWFLLLVGVKLGDQNGWPVWATVVGGLAGIGIFGGLLSAAVRVAKLRQREEVAG